jgi:periplasmic divalent cation tolerance protein
MSEGSACVNQLGSVQSTYRWQGAIEEASEVTLLIKTTRDRYADLEAELHRLHPYSVPEILAVAVERGSPDYLTWVRAETRADTDQNG